MLATQSTQSTLEDMPVSTETLKKKQKILVYIKSASIGFLLSIPLTMNTLSRLNYRPWEITLCVAAIGIGLLILNRLQHKFQREVTRACHQLGPGVKLVQKYRKPNSGKYLIFQEGHRYYYLQHMQTGEKRLVAKEKILQDFELAP